jgi:hypothetical protein
MKKVLFSLLAVFVVSVLAASCDGKNSKKDIANLPPEEQFICYLEEMVDLVKDTHIKDARDAKEFSKAFKEVTDKIDEVTKGFDDYDPDIPEEKKDEIGRKSKRLMDEAMEEIQRIREEAREAGVDESELGLF